MFYGVLLGTVIVASCSCWPVAWIGLEINLMCFIAFAISGAHKRKSAMIYFVWQSCGSLLVLIGGMLGTSSAVSCSYLVSGLIVKLGLVPFHLWVPLVITHLAKPNLYLLITWQKLAPLILLIGSMFGLTLLSVVNAFFGAMTMSTITLLPLMLVFSGMVQIGWVMATNGYFTSYYLAVYFALLFAVVYFSDVSGQQFGWSLLNAGGLPPLSGFIIKLKAMLNIKSFLVVFLVGSSGLALASYVRLLLNTRLQSGAPTMLLLATCVVGLV